MHIDGEILEKVVYDICMHYKINSLMTFGSDPLLYPEIVCKIHSVTKK